jgi:hypothetical protein
MRLLFLLLICQSSFAQSLLTIENVDTVSVYVKLSTGNAISLGAKIGAMIPVKYVLSNPQVTIESLRGKFIAGDAGSEPLKPGRYKLTIMWCAKCDAYRTRLTQDDTIVNISVAMHNIDSCDYFYQKANFLQQKMNYLEDAYVDIFEALPHTIDRRLIEVLEKKLRNYNEISKTKFIYIP